MFVLSDRDDRNGVAFDDGLVTAACVVGAVGGERASRCGLCRRKGRHEDTAAPDAPEAGWRPQRGQCGATGFPPPTENMMNFLNRRIVVEDATADQLFGQIAAQKRIARTLLCKKPLQTRG